MKHDLRRLSKTKLKWAKMFIKFLLTTEKVEQAAGQMSEKPAHWVAAPRQTGPLTPR